jgi:hypothetical protein
VKEFGGYGRVRLLHLPGKPAGVCACNCIKSAR